MKMGKSDSEKKPWANKSVSKVFRDYLFEKQQPTDYIYICVVPSLYDMLFIPLVVQLMWRIMTSSNVDASYYDVIN